LKHTNVDIKAPPILAKLEYRALRDAARDDFRSFAMVEVLIQTGVTISELSEIKLEHLSIDDKGGNTFVPKKNNKESRTIPLNKAVIESIKNYIENVRPTEPESKFLFISKTQVLLFHI
jgi:integrase/recombinase XerC/integrase/recombinase XerD